MQRPIDVTGLASPPNGEFVAPTPAKTPRPSFNILRTVEFVAETIVIVALLAELVLVLANFFVRALFPRFFRGGDEARRLSLSILAFIGGAVAYRRREHAFVRILHNLVAPPGERARLVLSHIW